VLDGRKILGITSSLSPAGRVQGNPQRLHANCWRSYQGSVVLGLGFMMNPAEAQERVSISGREAEVLQPYLSGEDLNQRPDSSASRWIINFRDWSLADTRRRYPTLLARVEELVKPVRDKSKRANYRDRWWQYAERCPGLYRAIEHLDRVVVVAQVSSTVQPVVVSSRQVLSMMLVVFSSDDLALFGLLASAPHYWWTIARSSTLETRIRYTPSDVFETLPLPTLTDEMRSAGQSLHEERSAFMLNSQLGLTKTYNLINDPSVQDAKVLRLRDLHVAVDEAVFKAYGWTNLEPEHGHYETRQGVRWTVAPPVQSEILDRLLELNHHRYAEEVAAGLHNEGAKRLPRKKSEAVDLPTLFEGVPTLFGGVPTLFGKDS
jgi:hypothetical protein